MPTSTDISMRRTKLKAEEAALLAGELKKPSWESRNEGIHERVSFEDSIWGFALAGGAYYKTPLRVTHVKPDSRADKAGIRPGDKLLRINDIDTSTLTIQQAHEIIIESGIHIKLAVTAPEDEEDSYNCYEDPTEAGYDSEEERRKEEEKAKKRQVHARVSSYWSLQWPWVSKRRVIYRESNCFMVPSKYEAKHKDKFPPLPMLREQDDVVLHSVKGNTDKVRRDITSYDETFEDEDSDKQITNDDVHNSKKNDEIDINNNKTQKKDRNIENKVKESVNLPNIEVGSTEKAIDRQKINEQNVIAKSDIKHDDEIIKEVLNSNDNSQADDSKIFESILNDGITDDEDTRR